MNSQDSIASPNLVMLPIFLYGVGWYLFIAFIWTNNYVAAPCVRCLECPINRFPFPGFPNSIIAKGELQICQALHFWYDFHQMDEQISLATDLFAFHAYKIKEDIKHW